MPKKVKGILPIIPEKMKYAIGGLFIGYLIFSGNGQNLMKTLINIMEKSEKEKKEVKKGFESVLTKN